LIQSWDDENSGNQNVYSGTLPDGDYDSGLIWDNTQYDYCTYGPSFCIILFLK